MINMNNSTHLWNYALLGESDLSKILKITAYSVLLFLSFIGNSIILGIIYKNANRRMRTASNLFIFNMAISNLFLTILNVPFSLMGLTNDHEWPIGGPFGSFLCRFCKFSWFLSELISTGSLSAIAVDRFFLVYYPTQNFLNKKRSALSILLSWVIATSFSAPVLAYTDTIKYNNKLYCLTNLRSKYIFQVFAIVTFTMFIAAPLVILTVLYLAIIIKLLGQKPVGEDVNHQRLERKRKENYRICVMLLIIVFLFALCVLPYWTIYLYCAVSSTKSSVCSSTYYFQIAFLLTFVNAGANPYIYIFFSQTFKNGAKNLFFKVPVHPEISTSVNQTRLVRKKAKVTTTDL